MSRLLRTIRRPRRSAVLAALALGLSTLGTTALVPAGADPTTVASNLDNPRLLSFGPDGTLYVAEAGAGGSSHCGPGPEGGSVCFGLTGAITAVKAGEQQRIMTGLPSIGDEGTGGSAIGPSQYVVQRGGGWVLSMGGGIDLAQREALGPDGATLTHILSGRGTQTTGGADIGAFESAHNPDHSTDQETGTPTTDSDPQGFVANGGSYWVADAGGNTLLHATRSGHVSVAAVFPPVMVLAPPFLELPPGTKIPAQAVPTDVVRGSDGALYVSTLTGFPFAPGAASIYRVVPGEAPTVYATGLTNVTSLAWSGGSLYAVQISDAGLASGGAPIGSLVRVTPTGNVTVAGGLFAPYGVAIRGGSAYVSTCAVCAGSGSVIRVPLS